MRKIALEEHFTTADLGAYQVQAQSGPLHVTAGADPFEPIRRRLSEFDEMRLGAMDRAGIDLAVLSVTTPGVQAEPEARTAVRIARAANDFLAGVVARHPSSAGSRRSRRMRTRWASSWPSTSGGPRRPSRGPSRAGRSSSSRPHAPP